MIVTFVSQCEKKSLAKTRRVLDAFANRIGSNTWQTVITNEGLQAVKTLLRKTASKNTAVSCYWLRSRSRSELVWVVGNRDKFDGQGSVPVNRTKKNIMNMQWENDWEALPLIQHLVALAALFHDWGKASVLFQEKLQRDSPNKYKGDPLRHEWISLLFFHAYVNGEDDEQWLNRLAQGQFDLQIMIATVQQEIKKPMADLSPAASCLAWLIVSHHRLPLTLETNWRYETANTIQQTLKRISQCWGYENNYGDDFNDRLGGCFKFAQGLPTASLKWLNYAKKNATYLKGDLTQLSSWINNGSIRLILHHARLSLMLADHYISSKPSNSQWRSRTSLFANTDKSGELKQKLDEHLWRVAKQAVCNAHFLPAFESQDDELPRVYDIKALKVPSKPPYCWQDKAVTAIKTWRNKEENTRHPSQFAFFAVNMASTGQGKTFANAKIIRALSTDSQSLRFILALGLRTLTLQTGDEYRERIHLDKDELAVLIGSKAILDLHEKTQGDKKEEKGQLLTGSESEETLLDNEIIFDAMIPEKDFTTILNNNKNKKFLYAPVLTCTIDHLMAATETKRGGRYILPALRLMSSDLVIDEIDDFTGDDLIAIGRLIHLTGMLGRKVMISSATIPPDLAEGYFNAYQMGWNIFATMRNRTAMVGCAWIDENHSNVESIDTKAKHCHEIYQEKHQLFVANRIKNLAKKPAKRKANIVSIQLEEDLNKTVEETYFSSIQSEVIHKHQQHHRVHQQTGKKISFGVVRIANISPCVALTHYLLQSDWPKDVNIRAMAYHSQQTLIMRNEQEKHLDTLLKKNKNEQDVFTNPVIKNHINESSTTNCIFILIATPVEEVGRDHDFDWAVVEPSSYRSFIQLAGRILRHRIIKKSIQTPNMALMQYNLRALLHPHNAAFQRPGYESEEDRLNTHDLRNLVDESSLLACLDAYPRIVKSNKLDPANNLSDLEHHVIQKLLTSYQKHGPESLQGWLSSWWWMTALPQCYVKFRNSMPEVTLYLFPKGDKWVFVEKDDFGQPVERGCFYNITMNDDMSIKEAQRLWLTRSYTELLEKSGKPTIEKAALIYGEIGLPTYGKEPSECAYAYSSQFGLIRL